MKRDDDGPLLFPETEAERLHRQHDERQDAPLGALVLEDDEPARAAATDYFVRVVTDVNAETMPDLSWSDDFLDALITVGGAPNVDSGRICANVTATAADMPAAVRAGSESVTTAVEQVTGVPAAVVAVEVMTPVELDRYLRGES